MIKSRLKRLVKLFFHSRPFIRQHRFFIFTAVFALVLGTIIFFNPAVVRPKKGEQLAVTTNPSDWTQLQHDSQHTGRTAVAVPPEYQVAWGWFDKNHIVKNFVSAPNKNIIDGFGSGFISTVQFSGQMQPIIADGKTFFGDMDGRMYAVNALTGDNLWDFASGGPILGTAAYDSNVLVFGSMDGKVYGLDANTGQVRWAYQTGAGINAAPIINNGVVYVGSRDGKFYALDLLTTNTNGSLRWSQAYRTRVYPDNPNSPFNLAPIIAPAAISEDGLTVFFGAENMFFYALNTADGSEKWSPKKVIGQSFLYTWPVVKGDKVIVRIMSGQVGAEWVWEPVLDGMSANPTWTEEKNAVLTFLQQNPNQKTMYVFNVNTGQESYQVAMGRVTGNNFPPHIAVVDNNDRLMTYWRSKHATMFVDSGAFGSKYCPDISAMNLSTGDRVTVNTPAIKFSCPELDNGFQPTVGGDWLYMHNHFRGAKAINVVTGSNRGITVSTACDDGACWRGGNQDGQWGFEIVYYGNDAGGPSAISPIAPTTKQGSIGFAGIAIAQTSGQSMLYINEGAINAVVAIKQSP